MRTLINLLYHFLIALIVFVLIQAGRGYFDDISSIFSKHQWLAMPVKDLWILIACMFGASWMFPSIK